MIADTAVNRSEKPPVVGSFTGITPLRLPSRSSSVPVLEANGTDTTRLSSCSPRSVSSSRRAPLTAVSTRSFTVAPRLWASSWTRLRSTTTVLTLRCDPVGLFNELGWARCANDGTSSSNAATSRPSASGIRRSERIRSLQASLAEHGPTRAHLWEGCQPRRWRAVGEPAQHSQSRQPVPYHVVHDEDQSGSAASQSGNKGGGPQGPVLGQWLSHEVGSKIKEIRIVRL